MSGLIEHFALATDTKEQLIDAIKIVLVWNHSATHFKTGKDIKGRSFLTLQWAEGKDSQPLIAPLKDASAIADQVYAWLNSGSVQYGREPDHDGSNSAGWLLTNSYHIDDSEEDRYEASQHSSYNLFTVYPYWIEYHK